VKSWKTTAAGLVAAIGTYLVGAEGLPPWWKHVGNILQMVGVAGIGMMARDNNVTSEQAGLTESESE
jgi:hypothetical protein